jgi:IS5 family transposase
VERNLYTFGDLAVSKKLKKVRKANVLYKILKLVNWERIRSILSIVDFRNTSHYGRDCYDPLIMFKILLLQTIYNLSDREIEEHLNFNMLFMQFCGFSIDSDIPDHSTIARWRDRFIDNKIYEAAFEEFNYQLETKGLEIKNGSVVDAAIVLSKSRPRKKVIIDVEPVGDEVLEEADYLESNDTPPTVVSLIEEESNDTEARWLKKGKKSFYGYKEHVSTNKDGYINALITTPANVSDTKMFPELLEKASPKDGSGVYGDKAYSSKKNRDLVASKNLNDHIMHKHKRNAPKDEAISNVNRAISKVRYVVERTFGGLKHNLGGSRSRYIGQVKTHNFNLIRAIAYNLIRATNHVHEQLCLN